MNNTARDDGGNDRVPLTRRRDPPVREQTEISRLSDGQPTLTTREGSFAREEIQSSPERDPFFGDDLSATESRSRAGRPHREPGVCRTERCVGAGCHRHARLQQGGARIETPDVSILYIVEIGVPPGVDETGIRDDGEAQRGNGADDATWNDRAVLDAVTRKDTGGSESRDREDEL